MSQPSGPAGADGLCQFIDGSPSPYHVCATVAAALTAAGYTELAERDRWQAGGRYFTVRAASIVAWNSGGRPDRPFRVVGGHTDSPNLRVKQHPDRFLAGWQVVALQPYGGAWLNSWLDRDLGVSGRLSVRERGSAAQRLVCIDSPVLRVPQLAIHLAEDRKSVTLDPQRHVNAVWGVGNGARSFMAYVADQAGVDVDDVLGADLMTHDVQRSRVIGAASDLLSAPRLDNQATCYAGLRALLAAEPREYLPVLALFDHEEVGSTSDHGAQSNLLTTVLERIVLAEGGSREDYLRRLPASVVASGDMAHATHPNYPERHEPAHLIEVNAGPVLKVQPNNVVALNNLAWLLATSPDPCFRDSGRAVAYARQACELTHWKEPRTESRLNAVISTRRCKITMWRCAVSRQISSRVCSVLRQDPSSLRKRAPNGHRRCSLTLAHLLPRRQQRPHRENRDAGNPACES